MKNKKIKTRIFLSAMVLIMLSVVLIAGGTYGLFTTSTTVTNHLQAGNLTAALFRTSCSKKVLDNDGYLKTVSDDTRKEFTSATEENIFGLTSGDYIVPGSEFETNLEICNYRVSGSTTVYSTVAFDYSVTLKLGTSSSHLKDQVTISYKTGDGTYTTAGKLSSLNENKILSGQLKGRSADSAKFSIKITFPDLNNNNDAQNEIADFDLIISAVQATSRS